MNSYPCFFVHCILYFVLSIFNPSKRSGYFIYHKL